MDENVARVSELCVEINNKIGDLQRREVATFKEQSGETYGALRCAWPSAATVFWERDPCVRQWMADSTTCPHCNTDDATTLFVRGLDGLIDLIKQ